ncbi:unnamed protein product [Urochloa humidicola]
MFRRSSVFASELKQSSSISPIPLRSPSTNLLHSLLPHRSSTTPSTSVAASPGRLQGCDGVGGAVPDGGVFLAAGFLFAPDALVRIGSDGDGAVTAAAAARLVHLLAFATAWGAGLWVTFIRGIVMFKYMPRHHFGSLRGKRFPA